MLKELLKKAIAYNNPYFTKEELIEKINLFASAGKITEEDKQELFALLGVEAGE